MDLLDDIPLVPLPEEMGGGRAPGPPSAAPPPALPLARSGSLSGYSSATAAHTSAGGSTGSLGAVAAAVPLAPPRAGYARPRLAPPSLAPMHGVSAAVLAAARGLATPPGSGMPPLVGYAAAQPDRLTTMSLKVRHGAAWLVGTAGAHGGSLRCAQAAALPTSRLAPVLRTFAGTLERAREMYREQSRPASRPWPPCPAPHPLPHTP
jgi:hypothetical protein